MVWPSSGRLPLSTFLHVCSKHCWFSHCYGNNSIFLFHIVKKECVSSVFERKVPDPFSRGKAGWISIGMVRVEVSDHCTPKFVPTCFWSGVAEHGSTGWSSKCGEEKRMVLKRVLLGDMVMVLRRQGMSSW